MSLTKLEVLNGSSNSGPEEIPWLDGNTIRVRGLRASEAGKVNAMVERVKGLPEQEQEAESLIGWFSLGVCNEDGSLMFDESDLDAIRVLPLQAVQRAAKSVMEKSGTATAGT